MKDLVAAAALAGITLALPQTGVAQEILASGTFRDADAAHKGEGTATITRTEGGMLTLALTDFATTSGPDLRVWLVEADNIQSADDVTNSNWLTLGPLQDARGDQTYAIPGDADVAKYKSAVIWCEPYNVLFATADLEPAV